MPTANTDEQAVPGRRRGARGLTVSGVVLLGWSGAALLTTALGQADLWLTNLDPAWIAALAGAVFSAPPWMMWVTVLAGAGLIWLGRSGGNSRSR